MPRIPIISSGSQAVVVPAPRAYGVDASSPYSTFQQGMGNLSGTLFDIASRLQDQKADIEITEVGSLYNAQIRLKKEEILSNPDIEDPTQEFLRQEELIQQEAVAKLTMPRTQRAFSKLRAKSLPEATADMALGELKIAALKAGAGVKRTVEMRTNDAAAATTMEERTAIEQEIDVLLERSVGRRVTSAADAEVMLKRRDERVDSTWATRRSVTDPLGTADDLRAGKYKGIPQDRAERLANVLLERAERDQKEAIRLSEHNQRLFNSWFVEQKHAKETELTISAGNGTLSLSQLEQDARDWMIHSERYQAIRNILEKPDRKEASDPDTLTEVSIDSNSGRPRISLAALASLRSAGKLNQTDFDRESQKRLQLQREDEREARMQATTSRSLAATERGIQNQEYIRAAELLRANLGIPTQWEKLDPVTKKLYSAALTELQNRSKSVSGLERSPEVVRDIINRFAPQLDHQAMLDAKQIEGTIRFKTWADLEANKDKMSLPEYQNNERALIRLKELNAQAEARAAAKAAEAPKPGGIFDWFKSRPKENQPGSPNRRPQ